jgi:hypothetical protein
MDFDYSNSDMLKPVDEANSLVYDYGDSQNVSYAHKL